jgi:uncharacterized membrane protein YedE/YeeE
MKALGKGSIASIIKIGLDIVWVVLWLAAIALAVAALASVGLSVLRESLFGGDVRVGNVVRIDAGGIEVRGVGADTLGWPLVVTGLLAGAVGVGASLVIVDRLRRLFAKFTSNAPFDRENAGHLRVIWITMLCAELARYAITGLVVGLVVTFGRPEGVTLNVEPGLNLSTWGAILILVVLAEGARLREEQDLTI